MRNVKSESGQTLRSSASLKRVSQGVRATVRTFRVQQTPAEQAFWELVRDRRLDGLKFRRQFPISIFVADFCCFELRLIVELDAAYLFTVQGPFSEAPADRSMKAPGGFGGGW